jgi:hypothetical protein
VLLLAAVVLLLAVAVLLLAAVALPLAVVVLLLAAVAVPHQVGGLAAPACMNMQRMQHACACARQSTHPYAHSIHMSYRENMGKDEASKTGKGMVPAVLVSTW